MISSEIEELIGMCDRILVMAEARSAAASSAPASTARTSCGAAMWDGNAPRLTRRTGPRLMSYRNRLAPRSPCRTRRSFCSSLLVVVFSLLSGRFLTPVNFLNILTQAAHIAIIAIGMTFVLLIAGIDLSVGANMYVARDRRSASIMQGLPPIVGRSGRRPCFGLAFGIVNAFFITRLRVAAFITTLATLFIGRGVALYFSGTKMVPFGKSILTLRAVRLSRHPLGDLDLPASSS